MKTLDLIIILTIFIFITIASCLITTFYILYETNSCTVDPIGYGVEEIRSITGATYVYGNINIIRSDGKIMSEPFGDYNISIE